ncbi:zf-HC2 domain-containing protein [Actinoplanes sp. NPDC051494]|uniref:zf-HC2 domain-containing protein n=1 Tax=Actinoplanes sp. NPDC051494 TaxID=3363907 RepID=UPI00379F331E
MDALENVRDESHVAVLLGPYYADRLGPDDNRRVEEHLPHCAACQAHAGEVCEALAAIALLPAADRDRLRAGVPTRTVTSARRHRPARWTAHRVRALVQNALVAAAVLMSGGLVLSVLIDGDPPEAAERPVPVAATVSASDRSTGASISLLLTSSPAGATLKATVSGLVPATGYRMYAVTTDGAAIPVVSWTGDGVVQDVSGDVRATPASLSFVTVVRADGGTLVSVTLAATPR